MSAEGSEEYVLWRGSPSQLQNTYSYLVAAGQLGVVGTLAYALMFWPALAERWVNYHGPIGQVLGAVAVVVFLRLLWAVLVIRFFRYEITNERVRIRYGVFSRTSEEIELYRVKDITLYEPFYYRIFGLSTIQLETSDRSHPRIEIEAIPNGGELREKLRVCTEAQRTRRGVREVDV